MNRLTETISLRRMLNARRRLSRSNYSAYFIVLGNFMM